MQILTRLKKDPIILRAEFNQDSYTSQSKLDRNSNEDRSEFELSSCRIRVALRKISKGFKRVLDKVWARFSP